MGLQVAAAGKIINEFTGLAFAGGEFETDNPAIRFVSAEAWTANAQGAHITFATAPIGTSSPVEGMRLTSEGILLVGTDTASGSAKLQVAGAIKTSADITTTYLVASNPEATNDVTATRLLLQSGTDVTLQTLYMSFNMRPSATGGNRYATIQVGDASAYRPLVLQPSGGNLLIGTTTDDGASKLQVAGTATAYSQTVYNPIAVTGSTSLVVRAGAGQTGPDIRLATSANAAVMEIYSTSGGGLYFESPGVANSQGYILPSSGIWKIGGNNAATVLVGNNAERIRLNTTGIGFFGATPVVKQTVTADAASILAALQAYGLAV